MLASGSKAMSLFLTKGAAGRLYKEKAALTIVAVLRY
jgi:hypothetical protein